MLEGYWGVVGDEGAGRFAESLGRRLVVFIKEIIYLSAFVKLVSE
tara:strand:+ start:254 stop:388 length:135 start_codon:yes stop_codon:yes gene_type:complete